MSAIQALLIATLYAIAQGGVCMFYFVPEYNCYFMGFVVGLILGDPVTGILIGAGIQLINLGWTGFGGAVPSDILLASIAGTAFAVAGGLSVSEAVALSVPLGAIGVVIPTIIRTMNTSVWCPFVDRAIENMNIRNIRLGTTLFPFLATWMICVPWLFALLYWGTGTISSVIGGLPEWLTASLNGMGAILPALGFGTYLNVIASAKTIPFFVIGFFIMKYFDLPIFGIAVIGFLIAYAGLYFDKDIELFN